MRIIQVGLGGFGRNWAKEVIPTVPGAEVVATADSFEDSRERAIAEGLTTAELCFDSAEAALAAVPADAVLVTASLVGHLPAARAALEAGCHVLIEKPFAPSVAEAEELLALAESKGLTVAVSQNYRFFPAVQAVTQLVADQTYGPLNSVGLDFRQFSGRDGRRGPHHALDEPLLVDMSIHHFDLIRTVLGREITRVDLRTWDPDWSLFSGPSAGVGIFECGPDVTVGYRGSWVSPGPRTTWGGEWRMDFAEAEVWWTSRGDGPAGWLSDVVRVTRGRTVETLELPHLEHTDRAGTLNEFITAVTEGREPTISGRNNLGTLAATYATVESAAAAQPVTIAAVSGGA